jgi:hypothetical protein
MDGPWYPVPDRRKPNLPYRSGFECLIRPHIPPRPFGTTYKKGSYPRKRAGQSELEDETASSWCLSHPPLDTGDAPGARESVMRITESIACEDGRGAQLVRCILDGNDSKTFVAKIYDPLYYSFVSQDTGGPVDVTYVADHDYSREAAAYRQLKHEGVDGKLVPKYYGSWTFTMGLHKEPDVRRPVRMILLEWLPGHSMHHVLKSPDFARMSPQHRLDILGAAMETYCLVDFHKVLHGDFAPRNVLLVGSDVDVRMPRVMLIDFNFATVYADPNSRRQGFSTDLPFSPRHLLWSSCPDGFEAWCPPPHRDKKKVFKGWLKKRWDGAEGFASAPPEGLSMFRQYDEPVEEATPVEDREYYQRDGPPIEYKPHTGMSVHSSLLFTGYHI